MSDPTERGAARFERPEVAAAFDLWRTHGHPFTCGGGGGPDSGVELELIAANPHAILMECPICHRQQFEHQGGDSLFDLIMRHAKAHDPYTCFTCRYM